MRRQCPGPVACAACLLLALALPACAQPVQPSGTGTAIAPAAAEWQALRIQRGHFDGARWNEAVDRWQGRKHVLMQQLAAHAWRERLAAGALEQLMGAADATVTPGSEEHAALVQRVAWRGRRDGELWLYRWRGTHDQLVFALVEGRVVGTGWVMAGE